MSVPSPSTNVTGEYRFRETVDTVGTLVVLNQPLTVTRLNQPAIDLLDHLDSDEYRSPASIAATTNYAEDAVEDLLDRLYRRGILEWRPVRDPEFRPPVSVVVTVRDDRENLERCLDALADLTYSTYEVVVVDDGSTDGTRDAATDHQLTADGCLRLVSVGEPNDPLGIGASRNRGVEAAANDVIAFTDADCRPRADWLDDLVPFLAAADFVGGRIRPAETTTASVYEGINSSLDMGSRASRVQPDGDTPYLATANVVGRRAVFEAIPFPDRNVAEDVDVSWRAVHAGFDVVYTPTGVVEHAYRTDIRSFAGRRSTYGASEALLAATHDTDGERIDVSTTHGLIAAAGLGGIILSRPIGIAIAMLLIVLTGLVGGVTLWRRYRRLPSIVSAMSLAKSWVRERLSTLYSAGTEVTRYYAAPIAMVGLLVWFVGEPVPATVLFASVGVAIVFPAAVEYRVHRPATSRTGYLLYYLADHLSYQYGVFRGAVRHRTLSHVRPSGRFRLVGPGTSIHRRFRDTSADDSLQTVVVGDVSARFIVDATPEQWWFDAETLQGERNVVEELLERLQSDDVFYDIGANIGMYSCLVGQTLEEGAVVAFEPHPPNADRLSENLSENEVDARLVRKALGSTNGYGTLTNTDSAPGTGTSTLVGTVQESGASRATVRSEPSNSIPVSSATQHREADRPVNDPSQSTLVTTGDSLVQSGELPAPTVVKIDVEGTELDVLHGLRGTVSTDRCRLVYCELHPNALTVRGNAPDEVQAFLRECGFTLTTVQEFTDGRTIVRARKQSSHAD